MAVRGFVKNVVRRKAKAIMQLPQTTKKMMSTAGSWRVKVRSPVAAPAPQTMSTMTIYWAK